MSAQILPFRTVSRRSGTKSPEYQNAMAVVKRISAKTKAKQQEQKYLQVMHDSLLALQETILQIQDQQHEAQLAVFNAHETIFCCQELIQSLYALKAK